MKCCGNEGNVDVEGKNNNVVPSSNTRVRSEKELYIHNIHDITYMHYIHNIHAVNAVCIF